MNHTRPPISGYPIYQGFSCKLRLEPSFVLNANIITTACFLRRVEKPYTNNATRIWQRRHQVPFESQLAGCRSVGFLSWLALCWGLCTNYIYSSVLVPFSLPSSFCILLEGWPCLAAQLSANRWESKLQAVYDPFLCVYLDCTPISRCHKPASRLYVSTVPRHQANPVKGITIAFDDRAASHCMSRMTGIICQ